MKNRILYIAAFLFAIAGLSGCDEETTAGLTEITYYPTLEVLGEPVIFVDLGDTYVDTGAVAILNGEDITDEIEIISNVNTAEAGVYSVNYKVLNDEGFAVTGSRTVYVADPTPSIISSGVHTTAVGTQRFWLSSGAIVPFSGYEIVILQTAPGEFYITDFMGGYYDQRVGYGSNFAMEGTFKVNEDNTITALSSFVPGWGDSLDYLSEGTVDPVTGQISYKLGYAGLMEYTIIIN
ncbi:MAG: DUF5012 domain-containing protein [Prolixibacteraceae bacterium]|nr:DUF5012 domain-containing protein [Prolixibacteraceae bacterium]